jgi:SPX domain protein involved in polyphosphate accumulation
MKFGKDFRNHLEGTLPDWKDKYLAYKALKKLIKTLPTNADADQPPLPPPAGAADEGLAFGDVALGYWFARTLDVELQKLNDFYIEREEWYVIRLQVRAPTILPLSSRPARSTEITRIRGDRDLDRVDFGLCWGIDG